MHRIPLEKTSQQHLQPEASVIHGYTRLRFFDIRFWEFLMLMLLVLGIAFYLFPRHKLLVSFYLEKGMLDEALAVMADMIKENPEDPELLILMAELHQKSEVPDKAVADLKLAVAKDPDNIDALTRLTTYYEWNRSPLEAVQTLEKIAAADPDNFDALKRLWEYYRYYGQTDKEVATVVRLIALENRLPRSAIFPEIEDNALLFKIVKDPLYLAVTKAMQRLVFTRQAQPDDLFIDELLRRLYARKTDYVRAVQNSGATVQALVDKASLRFLEAFVKTGMIDRAKRFAIDLDRFWDQGIKARLKLVQVMRWFRLDRRALDMLAEIGREFQNDIHVFVQMARIARGTGDLATAVLAYEQLVLSAPDNSSYQHRLAALYLESGKVSKAFDMFKKIALLPDATANDMRQLFETAIETGRPEAAREAALLGKTRYPRDAQLQRQAAEMLLAAGDEPAAIAALQEYLIVNPDDENAREQLAELYLWNNRPAKAYAIFKSMAVTSGGDEKLVARMLEVAGLTGSNNLISDAVRIAKRLRPRDAQLQRQAAEMLLAAGDETAAIAALQEYLNVNPDDKNARMQLAQLLQWNNQAFKAAGLYGKLSDADPQDDNKALLAGNAYIEAGETPKGIEYLQRALALRNDDIPLRKRLATYYQWVGDQEKMMAALVFLDARGQASDDQKLALAQGYLDKKNGLKALKYLKPYASQELLSPGKGIMLATAYEQAGKAPAAVKILKRLAKENASDPKLLADIGNRALGLNRPNAALDFFTACLKKDPKNLAALKGSGQILAWNNNSQKAMARFEAYNRLNPNDLEVRYQLGEIFFNNGRKGDAFRQYKKSLSLIKKAKYFSVKKPIVQ